LEIVQHSLLEYDNFAHKKTMFFCKFQINQVETILTVNQGGAVLVLQLLTHKLISANTTFDVYLISLFRTFLLNL